MTQLIKNPDAQLISSGLRWRKAQITGEQTEYPHLYQKYIFVRVDIPPTLSGGPTRPPAPATPGKPVGTAQEQAATHWAKPRPCYQSNLKSWTNRPMMYAVTSVTLTDEYTNIAPPIPFEDWSNSQWKGTTLDQSPASQLPSIKKIT